MITGVALPAWKRFNTRFINPETLNLLNEGNEAQYNAYIKSFGDIIKGKYVLGNIDGYLPDDTAHVDPALSVAQIDAEKGRRPSDRLFSLLRIDTSGRGKFHSLDESFLEIDRGYARGFYLQVKKDVQMPLVEFISATQENSILVHHDLIILEPETHLVLLRIVEGCSGSMVVDSVEVYAGRDSRLEYITLNKSGNGAFYATIKQAEISGHARVDWYNVDLYESHTAMSTRSTLMGQGAESGMTGIVISKGESQKDISYETFHRAPDTSTAVYVRAALMDSSRITYRALTHIASGSRRAKVEQAEKSITLGEKARFDGIPSLWIDEDDVIASHSVSSGMVDEQTMFYLKSRGIPHKQAEKLVTEGFIASMLNKEPVSLLKGFY